MSERVNVETFQIRHSTRQLTVERGLTLTAYGRKKFIDPQIEPSYATSPLPAQPKHLKIQLARFFTPDTDKKIEAFSATEAALAVSSLKDMYCFRMRQAVQEPVGRMALVSSVNHWDVGFPPPPRLGKEGKSLAYYETQGPGGTYNKPWVHVALLAPGASITVDNAYGGEYSFEIRGVTFRYEPDTEQGLVYVPEAPPRSEPPRDSIGVREPRSPLPLAPLEAAVAVDIPR